MKRRRKIVIIDPVLQYRMGGVVLLSGAVTAIIFLMGLKFLSGRVIDLLEKVEGNQELQLQVISEFNSTSLIFIALTAVSIIWAFVLTLYLTNRVVGPIQNIMNTLDRYAEGDKSARVQLRKNDFFQPLAEKLNKALDERN